MVHLINGNHFHPSPLREGIITVLFSFPFLPGLGQRDREINVSLYILLQAHGYRLPLRMRCSVMRHSFLKDIHGPSKQSPHAWEETLQGILVQSGK